MTPNDRADAFNFYVNQLAILGSATDAGDREIAVRATQHLAAIYMAADETTMNAISMAVLFFGITGGALRRGVEVPALPHEVEPDILRGNSIENITALSRFLKRNLKGE